MDLAKVIAAWLGTTKYSKVSILHNQMHINRRAISRINGKPYVYDHGFAAIGSTWVAVESDGEAVIIEAADPEFFNKLEIVVKKANGHS